MPQPSRTTTLATDEPAETVTIPLADLISLVAAAKIYIDAFADEERMSITERLALQDVEDAVERWKQRQA